MSSGLVDRRTRRTIPLGLVVVLLALGGCSEGGSEGNDGDGLPTPPPGADSGFGFGDADGASCDGDAGDGDAGDGNPVLGDRPMAGSCSAGQSLSFVDPQSGRQVSVTVEGTVSEDGRQLCKAVWETDGDQGGIQRMEMYYTQDGSFTHVLYYDDRGNLVDELELPGDGGAP